MLSLEKILFHLRVDLAPSAMAGQFREFLLLPQAVRESLEALSVSVTQRARG